MPASLPQALPMADTPGLPQYLPLVSEQGRRQGLTLGHRPMAHGQS